MIKRRRRPVEKWGWMTTYSDMMTLLLCFFVFLYTFSSIDSSKWQVLVNALNPSSGAASDIIKDIVNVAKPGQTGSGMGGVVTFDDISRQMEKYVEDNNLGNDIEVHGGDGYTLIVFRNNIFFDGNSYTLKPEGKRVLDALGAGVAAVGNMIKEIRIMGHTNQADPEQQNPVRGDRFLASDRATEVLVYMQEKNIIDPKKLISIGYGQFYPVAPFVREEDRLKNRRVEILITETNAVDISLDQVYSQMDAEQNR